MLSFFVLSQLLIRTLGPRLGASDVPPPTTVPSRIRLSSRVPSWIFPRLSAVDGQLPKLAHPRQSSTLRPSHSFRGNTHARSHAVPCHRGAGPRRLPAHRKPRPQAAPHP